MSRQEHKAVFTADNKDFKRKADEVGKKGEWLSGKLKAIGMAAIAAFSIRAIVNFGKEIIGLASKTEGVKVAFDRLNKPDLLDDLRTATRGTVTDLELMQKAVQAKNFKIPLDQLATYFEFATKRAIQTGESVDYLVNSIITGIGRKSVLVMDNLGISAVELQEEVKKTGDFAVASGNIINRELGSMGNVADTTATKMESFNATVTNLKTNMGKLVTESKLFNDALNDINRTVNNMVDQQNDLTTIQESGLSKWDKLLFKLAKFSKTGREAIDIMADGIRKQDELNTIVEEGIDVDEVHIDTIADYRVKIEELEASLETLTAGEGKRAEQIRQQIADTQKLIDETLNYKTALEEIAGPSLTSEFTFIGKMLTEDVDFSKEEQAIDESLSNIELAYTNAQLAAAAFGKEVMASSASGANSLLDFARVAVQTAKKIISAYLAEGIAAAVKKALTEIPFPFNIVAAGVAGGAAAALFNSLVPNFAAGGAVSGPTMAFLGEAPGISRSNPEYIGTAQQLSQMGIGGGTLRTEIKRDKMIFWLEEGKALSERSY